MGLRKIEQAVLKRQSVKVSENPVDDDSEATAGMIAVVANQPEVDSASRCGARDCCAVVRGILNDDQGGPLHPPWPADDGCVG